MLRTRDRRQSLKKSHHPDQMTARPSPTIPILATLAILCALLGAYVGGYFWLGEHRDSLAEGFMGRRLIIRMYRYEWQVTIFKPATKLETRLRGVDVHLDYPHIISGAALAPGPTRGLFFSDETP